MTKKKQVADYVAPEWSHFLPADEVGVDKPLKITISAGKEEMTKLVQRLEVLSVDALNADLILQRDTNPMVVHVTGRIRATLKQPCVVTLDPVENRVDEEFEAWFADPDQAIQLNKAKHEKLSRSSIGEVPMLDEADDPEPIVDGQIDLGELVTQYLSLALNPYPHAEGVHYEYGDDEPQKVPEEFKSNPFEALKDWKSKLED